jgi:broad specificity phosphatase PhoE
MPPSDARIVLVRHGETAWNAERRYQSRTDLPLNERGEAQARTLAERLRGAPLDRAFCSPMVRTRQTIAAVMAAGHPSLEVIEDARLREIDHGPFEGRTPAELLASPMADAYRRWHRDERPEFPEGTETQADASARICAFYADVAELAGTTLVVSHGSILRLLVVALLQADPAAHRRLWLANAAFVVVDPQDRPVVTGVNVTEIPA